MLARMATFFRDLGNNASPDAAPAAGGGLGALRVKLLRPEAVVPARATDGSAGYDLTAAAHVRIEGQGGRAVVPTGVAIAVPPGTYGRVAPRSGLAVRDGIGVLAGVVDADYRGEVKVVLVNHGDGSFIVRPGERVAQLVLERVATPPVEIVVDLDASERGEGGFGSTGA